MYIYLYLSLVYNLCAIKFPLYEKYAMLEKNLRLASLM